MSTRDQDQRHPQNTPGQKPQDAREKQQHQSQAPGQMGGKQQGGQSGTRQQGGQPEQKTDRDQR